MPRSLSYTDAVRLLGGQDSTVVAAIEKLAGGVLLVAAPGVTELLSWFDAKGEFVRLSHELVRGLYGKRLSRYGRTERLDAARNVIVLVAFFESLPRELGDLNRTRLDQIAFARLAGGEKRVVADRRAGYLVELMQSAGSPRPTPQQSPEVFVANLRDEYRALSDAMTELLDDLALATDLSEPDLRRIYNDLEALPDRAVSRYQDLFRQLVADFPELACWASQQEHRATRAALAGLEEQLRDISTGREPDERRESLARAYRAALREKVVDAPDGIEAPRLGDAYLPPRFRVADVPSAARVSDESWWAEIPVRDDLEEFLVGHLTSPQATRAPLLVLGQPGAGKSVLTTVLAARLPAADFLPIRVVLRETPATDELQDQIEHAIRQATGERVDWPALSRSAGDAMPVILLDGFDELLQAAGVSQTDYLTKVARFQRREADQNRPVAVIVTSRTAVADRASAPAETVALRLEPFDDQRITTWLDTWNHTNATNLASRRLSPLTPHAVLAHRELAEQPLLLLMLALYDADGNALQRAGENLRTHELYERLLGTFATREITKHRPGLPDRDLELAVEEELRRLSVVAFAMFNRAAQWVTEADLETDLTALFGPATRQGGLRAQLRPAELTLGRFFFIHRARASRDQTSLQTYEFLHATFGEYLVARFTWQVLRDMAARSQATAMSLTAPPSDDDLLRALLSFQPLCSRGPVIGFLSDLASPAGPEERSALRELLIRLVRTVNHSLPTHRFADYRPATPGEPTRYAAYGANLLLLILCVSSTVQASDLFEGSLDVVESWHDQALLWRSQLTNEGWTSLVDTIALERVWEDSLRDVRLSIGGNDVVPVVDLYWTLDVPPGSTQLLAGVPIYHHTHSDRLRKKAWFQCSIQDDLAQHALEPLARAFGASVNTLFAFSEDEILAAANVLLQLMTNPAPETYRRAAKVTEAILTPWPWSESLRYATLVRHRLRGDPQVDPATAAHVLAALRELGYADDM
ncbi:NACHT domain-containing protein [Actinoplanes sp. CA-015351]|uniref:NACHT domain-containing protein n=1 Tax=Actinoplanes sp. CA-015351 TaxID=3239897 RepID=UPI003D986F18